MSQERRLAMYALYRKGSTPKELAKQFSISEAETQKIIHLERVGAIEKLPLEYMDSPEFREKNAEATILSPLPEPLKPQRKTKAPDGLPAYIAAMYDFPLLTKEQEVHLFRQYNYCKFRAATLRSDAEKDISTETMDEVERYHAQGAEIKNKLVESNLRLVVSVAKKYIGITGDLFEKISEGNYTLMRSVEKFDYTRGFKFSTYATWAIKKNYIAQYNSNHRRNSRFATNVDEELSEAIDHRNDPAPALRMQKQREERVASIMKLLDAREKEIIMDRFGLRSGVEPMTLKEVGKKIGVTKERVRQIETRALAKLRDALESSQEKSAVA